MSRLPWNNYPSRTAADEGGMEHLETDVMRFMAILAFCLVAIFALVQSMPLDARPPVAAAPVVEMPEPEVPAVMPDVADDPVEVVAAEPIEPPAPDAAVAAAATETPTPTPPPEPTPTPAAVPQPETVALVLPKKTPRPKPPEEKIALVMPKPRPYTPPQRPTTPPPAETPERQTQPAEPRPAKAAAVRPAPAPPTARTETPAPPAEPQRGFSLRFDSDDALRQLIARDTVALYAFTHGKAWRVMMVDQRLSFRPAQKPPRFHEMAPDTVPGDVVRTLRRLVTVSPDALTWGVTLPPATSRQLSEFLAAHDSGGLVIGADGALRLERS